LRYKVLNILDLSNKGDNTMEHIANKNARAYINEQAEFKGSNLSGKRIAPSMYVVYSFKWRPLWACIKGQWYGHKTKYSRTTSVHRSQSQPDTKSLIILDDVDDLRAYILQALS